MPLSEKAEGPLNDVVREGQQRLSQEMAGILVAQSGGTLTLPQLKQGFVELHGFGCLHGNNAILQQHRRSFRERIFDGRERLGGAEGSFCSRMAAALRIISESPDKSCLLLAIVSLLPA